MTESDRTALALSALSFWPFLSMSGECSGAGTDGSLSGLTSVSSVPSSFLDVRSTKCCKSPAPKASPSTLSTVQVRSLRQTEWMASHLTNCLRQQFRHYKNFGSAHAKQHSMSRLDYLENLIVANCSLDVMSNVAT